MRFLFIIQGEGRGHMTQAISLARILRLAGHEIPTVIVGKSERRTVPEFFIQKIESKVIQLDSPNFVTDKQQKSVKPLRTVIYSLLKARKYQHSINQIDEVVESEKPDLIINFYDFLGGLYNFSKRPKPRFVSIAHQFLISHPEFDFPPNRVIDKASLKVGNQIASLGADRILALSFQQFESLPEKKLFVVPPLLREEVKAASSSTADHFLIYMVNPGYAIEVDRFHQLHPYQPLHCFWDKEGMPEKHKVDSTLTYHQLNDVEFIQKMASAKGYVTTAGFESVCEAMYLGKPVLMVPVEGHYEQACNAVDAVKAGAGISSDTFSVEKLFEYLPRHKNISARFRDWTNQADSQFIKQLTQWP